MRKVCLILSLIIASIYSQAQQKMSDTLIVFVNERLEMKIILDDLHHLKTTDSLQKSLNQRLSEFQSHVKGISAELDPEVADVVKYKGDGAISLTKGEQKTVYLVQEDGLQASGSRDLGIIVHPEVRIELRTNDLSQLQNMPVAMVFDQMVARLPQKFKYARSVYFEYVSDSLYILPGKLSTNSVGDALELTGGVGTTLFKGHWIGEFELRADLMFFKKNVLRFNPYVSASLMYDFRNIESPKINTFLNLGFRSDADEGREKESRLVGFEFGYLMNRKGNLFEENTWRFGISWSPADGISVSPQMYIVGGFEKLQPGIRFSFGL